MTVSEDGVRGRFAMDEDQRERLGDEAWQLKDQGKSLRTIRDIFRARGVTISHTTVAELIDEAQTRAKFLDYVGPAQSRVMSMGRLDRALETALDLVETLAAAIATGEAADIVKASAQLDKAQARYASLEQIWIRVTGAAMPVRHQIEDPNGGPVTVKVGPNSGLLRELARVAEHEQRTKDMEETDGLG